MSRLDGKTALVTGSGAGIGASIARRLAAEGAAVLISDLVLEPARALAEELRATGARVETAQCDVADEDQVFDAVQHAKSSFGSLDIVINNAGRAFQHQITEAEVDDWNRVLAVNLTGTFLVTKHAARVMGEGSAIVNIASVAALMAVPYTAAYTAAKGGVVALTRLAAAELGPRIRVNCVCPGTTMTAMPADMLRRRGGGDVSAGAAITAERYISGRLAEPEEIASAAVFLAGPDSSFITGAVLAADGGATAL